MATARGTARAPRRGESGFAEHARKTGGDPRLRERQQARQQAAEESGSVAESPSPQARTPRSRKSRSSSSRSAVFQPSTRPVVSFQQWSTNDASGFVLGALAWILVLQYLDKGVPGVKSWLKAKFLNKGPDGKDLP